MPLMGRSGPFTDLTVIVPTLDEAGTIHEVVTDILKLCPGAEVIVADDGSTDGTPGIVLALGSARKGVRLLSRGGKARGLTASVLDALSLVGRPLVAVMDGDLQHPPKTLPGLVRALEGADIAVAVRAKVEGRWLLHRKAVSRAAHLLGRARLSLSGKGCADPLSGFFATRTEFMRRAVEKRHTSFVPQGYKVLFDLLKHAPRWTRVAEVPYTFNQRNRGESKMGACHILAFARSLIT